MPRPFVELLAALVVGGLCVAGYIEAMDYRGASGYLPTGVMVFGLVLAVVWGLQSTLALYKGEKNESGGAVESWWKLLVFVAAGLGYVIAIGFLGYFTTTIIFVPAVAAILGYRRPTPLLGASIIFVSFLYVLFVQVLQVPLPEEPLLQIGLVAPAQAAPRLSC